MVFFATLVFCMACTSTRKLNWSSLYASACGFLFICRINILENTLLSSGLWWFLDLQSQEGTHCCEIWTAGRCEFPVWWRPEGEARVFVAVSKQDSGCATKTLPSPSIVEASHSLQGGENKSAWSNNSQQCRRNRNFVELCPYLDIGSFSSGWENARSKYLFSKLSSCQLPCAAKQERYARFVWLHSLCTCCIDRKSPYTRPDSRTSSAIFLLLEV